MNRVYRWEVPEVLSGEEEAICQRLKRTGKLFVFLRRQRHRLFDEAFEAQLSGMYADLPRGTPPLPPALLAMVTLLQAYERKSDAAAVEEAVFDRRWQMVLGCLGESKAPFSQGVLVDFRYRLQKAELDQQLLEKTVELAKESGEFGFKALKVALDSAPLWGAGRVEDTFNLLGHALAILLRCVAQVSQRPREQIVQEAGLSVVEGSSVKAQLDVDWDDPVAQQQALTRVVNEVEGLRRWVDTYLPVEAKQPPISEAISLLEQLLAQDVEPDPDGGGYRIKRGTAQDRRISVSDGEMRHGRKSSSRVINGYKRHIARELEHGLILAVAVRPANEPEHAATSVLRPQVESYGSVEALFIDRGYLAANWTVELHERGKRVVAKPWSAANKDGTFGKERFDIDLGGRKVTCPAGQEAPIQGGRAKFAAAQCGLCALRAQCTSAKPGYGRTLTIHQHEAMLLELRQRQRTPGGREELRERVAVEHGLAHVCRLQGPRARYLGVRKNEFDLRRAACIVNLHAALRVQKVA